MKRYFRRSKKKIMYSSILCSLAMHRPSISCSFLNVLLICCVFDLSLPFQFDPKPLGGRLANKTE